MNSDTIMRNISFPVVNCFCKCLSYKIINKKPACFKEDTFEKTAMGLKKLSSNKCCLLITFRTRITENQSLNLFESRHNYCPLFRS